MNCLTGILKSTCMQIYKKNWRNKSVQLFMFVFIILGFSFGLGGCYKKQDTTLQVYVLDNTGSVVKDANVNVYAEPTDTSIHNPVSLNFSKITNTITKFHFFSLICNYPVVVCTSSFAVGFECWIAFYL